MTTAARLTESLERYADECWKRHCGYVARHKTAHPTLEGEYNRAAKLLRYLKRRAAR